MRFEQRGPCRFVLIPESTHDEEIIDKYVHARWETRKEILTTYIESDEEGCCIEFDLLGGDGDIS